MYKVFAIIINLYIILTANIYSMVYSITDYLYINKILNYIGNYLLIIPAIIVMLVALKIIETPIGKLIANIITTFSILALIGITINDLGLNEYTDFIIIKIYHPMALEVKKELYDISYTMNFNHRIKEHIILSDTVKEYLQLNKPLPNNEYIQKASFTEIVRVGTEDSNNVINKLKADIESYEPRETSKLRAVAILTGICVIGYIFLKDIEYNPIIEYIKNIEYHAIVEKVRKYLEDGDR